MSAKTDLISGITAMFSADVMMPTPQGFATGITEASEALRRNPDNSASRATWTPIRVGLSADGLHGFTFGYMTITKADNTTLPAKYMSYWVKRPAGWRVVAYKRAGRPAGEVSLQMLSPALPEQIVPSISDETLVAATRKSLDDAERAFSNEAQSIGLGRAFAKYGSADAASANAAWRYVAE